MAATADGTSPGRPAFPETPRFKPLGLLGQGAMGVVWEALDVPRDERVALKVLSRYLPRELACFKSEFRSLADLNHPHLVTMYELGYAAGCWFLTMQLIEGGDLGSYVRRDHAKVGSEIERAGTVLASVTEPLVEPGEATVIVRGRDPPELDGETDRRLRTALAGVAAGLDALHEAGFLHRDLKPTNILVEPGGHARVADFGLVLDRSDWSPEEGAGVIAGTVAYMSPEQARGATVDRASDWYALGVILYELLTGHLPHTGTVAQVLHARRHAPPELPVAALPGLPADLTDLCTRLLALDPRARPGADEILAVLGGEAGVLGAIGGLEAAALVGREAELERLRSAHREATAGAVSVVQVRGRSGHGKTALLQAAAQRFKAAGALVLQGRCREHETVPFKAFDAAVDRLARHLMARARRGQAAAGAGLLALTRLFPVLGELPGLSSDAAQIAGEGAVSRALRLEAFAAFARQLCTTSNPVATVLILDDLQWADQDSVAMLRALLSWGDRDGRLLVILGYRSEADEQSPALLALLEVVAESGLPPQTVDVGPLAMADACTLAGRWLGLPDDDPAAVHVARESARVPFLIEMLAAAFRARGDNGRGVDGSLSLADALNARLRGLPEGARAALEHVSLGAGALPSVVLTRALQREARPWLAIRALVTARLLRREGTASQERMSCQHDRVREVIAASLDSPTRVSLHARLAQLLTETGTGSHAELATHHFQAGDRAAAAAHARRAAKGALQAMAFEAAASWYARCLAWTDDLDDDGRRLLETARADALSQAGQGEKAADAYLRAAELATPVESRRLRRRAGQQLLECGHVERGKALLAEVLGELGVRFPAGSFEALARFVALRVWLRLRGLEPREPPLPGPREHIAERIDTCWTASQGLGMMDPIRGNVLQSTGLLLSLNHGDPRGVARSLVAEAVYGAAFGGRGYHRADALVARGLALAADLQDPAVMASVHLGRAIASFQQGRWRACLRATETSAALCRAQSDEMAWTHRTARIYKLLSLGWLGQLRVCHAKANALAVDAIERHDWHMVNHLQLGNVLPSALVSGDARQALVDLERAAEALPRDGITLGHIYAARARVQIALYSADPATAWARALDLRRLVKRSAVGRVALVQIYAHMLGGAAAVLVASGDGDRRARRALRRNGEALRRFGLKWTDALAEALAASLAWIEGRHAEARAHARRAQRRFEEADMTLHALATACGREEMGDADAAGAAGRFREAAAAEEFEDAGGLRRLLVVWPEPRGSRPAGDRPAGGAPAGEGGDTG